MTLVGNCKQVKRVYGAGFQLIVCTYIPMAKGFVYLVANHGLVQPPRTGMADIDQHGRQRALSRQ